LRRGIKGWVGLNQARDRGRDCFEVNPFVGVVHEELENRVARLTDGAAAGELPPSVTVHLAYLLPESGGRSRPWRFCANDDLEAVADSLAAAVNDHGLPFMRRLEDPRELASAIEERSFDEARAERLPLLFALMGDVDRARDALRAELAQVESDSSVAAEEFRRYAARLERELRQSVRDQ
jgi:hypothetical protein